jgi:LmbE family N-acetylglucosaminyl deacetylase
LPDFESCISLLCIQPHPDDNEIGAGATIAKLASNGCRITYLTVTDGRLGSMNPRMKPEKIVEVRKKEVEEAAGILGVASCIFLDYADAGLPAEEELCKSLVSVIRKVQPEFVLTVDPFLPYEAHPDHRRVGMAAAEACIFSQFPHFHLSEDAGPEDIWSVKGVVFHSTAYPNTYINADSTWDLKIKAISAHKSQFDRNTLEGLKQYFDFKARYYAERRGFLRAEALKVLTAAHLHMNVDTIFL